MRTSPRRRAFSDPEDEPWAPYADTPVHGAMEHAPDDEGQQPAMLWVPDPSISGGYRRHYVHLAPNRGRRRPIGFRPRH